jgi:hypothetical protein
MDWWQLSLLPDERPDTPYAEVEPRVRIPRRTTIGENDLRLRRLALAIVDALEEGREVPEDWLREAKSLLENAA